jgi:DNA-directed RNA polymerase beta' subunit
MWKDVNIKKLDINNELVKLKFRNLNSIIWVTKKYKLNNKVFKKKILECKFLIFKLIKIINVKEEVNKTIKLIKAIKIFILNIKFLLKFVNKFVNIKLE